MNSYLKFYDQIKVNFVKIDSNMSNTDYNTTKRDKNLRTSTSVLFNNFINTIDAFYFLPDSPFVNNAYSIYRKTPSQQYYNYVYSLENINEFMDYNIHNNDNYEYLVVVTLKQSDGSYVYQLFTNRDVNNNKVLTHVAWDSWSICNIEEIENEDDTQHYYTKTGDTWLLGLNMESEVLSQNIGVSTWDTLGRYPKVSIGQKNYESSTCTCLLGQMKQVVDRDVEYSVDGSQLLEDGTINQCRIAPSKDEQNSRYRYTEKINITSPYAREMEKLESWKKFCSDGKLKLLKDIKGNAWVVQIIDAPTHSIDNTTVNSHTTITFSWEEVEDITNMSIVMAK